MADAPEDPGQGMPEWGKRHGNQPTEPMSTESRHATRPIPPVPQAPTSPGASAAPPTSGPSPYAPPGYSQPSYPQPQSGAYPPPQHGAYPPPQHGAYPPPQYGYPQPYAYAQAEPKGLSIASMVCGIAALVGFGFFLLPQIAAVVLGHLAMAREPSGRGFAIAGLVMGYICLLITAVVVAFFVIAITSISRSPYGY
jgi:hypothetical protein